MSGGTWIGIASVVLVILFGSFFTEFFVNALRKRKE